MSGWHEGRRGGGELGEAVGRRDELQKQSAVMAEAKKHQDEELARLKLRLAEVGGDSDRLAAMEAAQQEEREGRRIAETTLAMRSVELRAAQEAYEAADERARSEAGQRRAAEAERDRAVREASMRGEERRELAERLERLEVEAAELRGTCADGAVVTGAADARASELAKQLEAALAEKERLAERMMEGERRWDEREGRRRSERAHWDNVESLAARKRDITIDMMMRQRVAAAMPHRRMRRRGGCG